MKPLAHARIAAYRYGGSWQDWLPYHDFFDSSKAALPSLQHRMFLHSDYGVRLFSRLFGSEICVAGKTYSAAHIATDHMEEDLGSVIPLRTWLAALEREVPRSRPPRQLASWRNDPLTGMAQRYGGNLEDFRQLLAFFDEPRLHFADDDRRADMVLHNAFGIFLCERVFGAALSISGRLIATRSIAEDLVLARIGHIPTAANVAASILLTNWMRGADVPTSLAARRLAVFDNSADSCSQDLIGTSHARQS